MLSLGMDIGTSTVKLVLLKNQEIEKQWMAVHHGNPFVCLKKGLSTLELAMDTPFSLCVTGSNTEALLEQDSAIPSLGDIPAIVEGVRWIIPQVGSVIEIGSQGARFITDLQSRAPQFAVNEHCAGGTGSFFEDQMSRVGCKLEDYSSLVEQAQSVPRLSGRCAVFAKTDMSDVKIGDAALFIRNEVLQFGGLACLDDVVHGKILLFQNDFGIDHSTVGFCAAQCFRRYIQHFSRFDRHFLPIDSQKKLAVSLTTQIKSGAVIVFRGNRSACAQGKPCYRHSIAQSGRSGNGHSIPDRANLGKCKRDIVHTAVSSRRATGTMLRTDRP